MKNKSNQQTSSDSECHQKYTTGDIRNFLNDDKTSIEPHDVTGNEHSFRLCCCHNRASRFTSYNDTISSPVLRHQFSDMTSLQRTLFVLYITWKVTCMVTFTFTVFLIVAGTCLRDQDESLEKDIQLIGGRNAADESVTETERHFAGGYVRDTERLSMVHSNSLHCLQNIVDLSWSQVSNTVIVITTDLTYIIVWIILLMSDKTASVILK